MIADGGTLRLSRVAGDVRISVFTSPTPPRVGTIDVSVLVQDAKSGAVRLGRPVRVRAWPVEEPAHELEAAASHDLATNKLLQAAHLDLDRPGLWRLAVTVGEAEVTADFELAGAAPSWWSLVPWVGWPFLLAGLFLLLQRLKRTKS
jgi:hypothetical protein